MRGGRIGIPISTIRLWVRYEGLLEAGPILSGALLQQGLIDEQVIYIAAKLLGDQGRELLHLPGVSALSEHIPLSITDLCAVGEDWRVITRIATPK